MTRPLKPFARADDGPVRALAASAAGDGAGGLRFRFVLAADLGALRIPEPRPPRQAGELWQHTCFEAFIAGAAGGGYRELNFSPSTEWAAYAFQSYRSGMMPVDLPAPPAITVTRSAGQLEVVAHVAVAGLVPEAWRCDRARLRIALSAVIEDAGGGICYWALRHAPGKPDFHHAEGFIIEIDSP